MFCTKCGADMGEAAKFCPECGAAAEQTEEMAVQTAEETMSEKEESMTTEEPVETQAEYEEVTETASEMETAATAAAEQSFDWQAAAQPVQPSPSLNLEKPKNNNVAAYIVIGVIGVAILAALIYVVVSLVGVGNPSAAVRNAFINTWADMTEKDAYTIKAEEILAGEYTAEEIVFSLDDFVMSESGMTVFEIPNDCYPIRLAINGTTGMADNKMSLGITGGLGDMNDMRIDAYMDKGNFMFALPDIWPEDKFLVTVEDLESMAQTTLDLSEGMDREEGQEALKDLGAAVSKWLNAMYEDIKVEKKGTNVIDTGDREIKAQEYYLTMSPKNYAKHLQAFPAAIENAAVFMGWLENTLSKAEADEFIDALYLMVEEMEFDEDVNLVEIAYVSVYDNKVVEIYMPTEEYDSAEGEMRVSFLGEKNVAHDMRIVMDIDDGYDSVDLEYYLTTDGAKNALECSMAMNEVEFLNMHIAGSYEETADSCTYNYDEFDLTLNLEDEGAGTIEMSLSGSYTLAKADSSVMPSTDGAINLLEMGDVELVERVSYAMDAMLEGNFVPSQWKDAFAAMKESLFGGYDDFSFGEGMDYGLLEDADTGASGYDVSDVVYGSSGLPYLFCADEDLIVELQPMEGYTFAPDYSSAYAVEYEKFVDGGNDLLVMDYEITEESCEEFLAWEADYWEAYYKESGYSTIEMGDIQYGVIGGHQAAWFEYSASEGDMKSMGIIAYAQIDENHGCTLDFYSLYGVHAPTEEMLYDSFNLYLIEQ